VCLAAEQHDIGMAEWDVHPTLNTDTGLPHSFMEMPLDTHLELWSAAGAKLLRQCAYAALLVSMHGSALYEMRDLSRMEADDADKVRAFLAARRSEQERLIDELGAASDEAEVDQRRVWTWDFMSLALCLDWAPASAERVPLGGEQVDVRMEPTGDRALTLDPWPFTAPALTVRCEGRRLAGGYGSADELHAALDDAPLVQLEWRLAPTA
jgi:Protein of unknown function (DUF3891)